MKGYIDHGKVNYTSEPTSLPDQSNTFWKEHPEYVKMLEEQMQEQMLKKEFERYQQRKLQEEKTDIEQLDYEDQLKRDITDARTSQKLRRDNMKVADQKSQEQMQQDAFLRWKEQKLKEEQDRLKTYDAQETARRLAEKAAKLPEPPSPNTAKLYETTGPAMSTESSADAAKRILERSRQRL